MFVLERTVSTHTQSFFTLRFSSRFTNTLKTTIIETLSFCLRTVKMRGSRVTSRGSMISVNLTTRKKDGEQRTADLLSTMYLSQGRGASQSVSAYTPTA